MINSSKICSHMEMWIKDCEYFEKQGMDIIDISDLSCIVCPPPPNGHMHIIWPI